MRDEVLMELVDRALSDAEFREQARNDPEATLKANGFDLTDDELEAVREFQQETAGLTEDELNERLTGGPRRQGA